MGNWTSHRLACGQPTESVWQFKFERNPTVYTKNHFSWENVVFNIKMSTYEAWIRLPTEYRANI